MGLPVYLVLVLCVFPVGALIWGVLFAAMLVVCSPVFLCGPLIVCCTPDECDTLELDLRSTCRFWRTFLSCLYVVSFCGSFAMTVLSSLALWLPWCVLAI